MGAGAPVPFPPFPVPVGAACGCGGAAFAKVIAKRKRANTSLLIVFFIVVYFKILVLTVSPLSETIFTTYEFLTEPSSSITKSLDVSTAFLEITNLPLIS